MEKHQNNRNTNNDKNNWENLNLDIRQKIQSSAFEHLIKLLQKKTEVQNIDLMELSGFCRNCLAKWLVASAKEQGIKISKEESRKYIYGMNYLDWKSKYQID